MICNYRKMKKGNKKEIFPNPKQNKFLLKIGASQTYGTNWSKYGYADTVRIYELTAKQVTEYNKLEKESPKKIPLSENEKILKWSKRLSKLMNISLEEAIVIAKEKIDYQELQIDRLEDKQDEFYSTQREKLINKIKRSNPLRRITDEEHARAILSASERHNNSDYESLLEEARKLAILGNIDKSEIKDYARGNFRKSL